LRRLFKRATDFDTILAIRDSAIPDPRELVFDYPDALWAIVRRALANDRDERYASAKDLADDLDVFVESQGAGAMGAFLCAVLDRLFPGERQKQNGWLEVTAALPANLNAPTMAPPAPLALLNELRRESSIPMQLVPKKKK
jgi:hypothetical protein